MLGAGSQGDDVPTGPGYLRHLAACNNAAPADYLPLEIAGVAVGRVRRDIARRLAEFPDLFAVSTHAITLAPGFADFDARSRAFDDAIDRMVAISLAPKRRNEPYAVAARFTDPPLARLDRGGVATLGVRSYGVHLNGYVRKRDG